MKTRHRCAALLPGYCQLHDEYASPRFLCSYRHERKCATLAPAYPTIHHLTCMLQGHLRLVLLPIVYNAMAQRSDLRITPFFKALHRTMKRSTYYPLLRLPSAEYLAELAKEEKAAE
jgi:hypothetical protein